MHAHSRSLTWHGQPFHFECLPGSDPDRAAPLWAVWRRTEFIGTMPCSTEITTKDFDLRGRHWLDDLLGGPQAKH